MLKPTQNLRFPFETSREGLLDSELGHEHFNGDSLPIAQIKSLENVRHPTSTDLLEDGVAP
jgi:hypothetical protein